MAATASATAFGAAKGGLGATGGRTAGVGTLGTLRTQGLGKSASLPTLLPGASASSVPFGHHARHLSFTKTTECTVSNDALMRFLFPASLENPNSCGRLELFARCGPADEEGNLRGGAGGSHIHTSGEINEMIRHDCQEAIFDLLCPKPQEKGKPQKPRSDCETTVAALMPIALGARFTQDEVLRLLRKVPRNAEGRMNFREFQEVVLESQRQRLKAIVKRVEGGKPICPPKERPIKVGYQSQAAAHLKEVAHPKRKYENESEVIRGHEKRMHCYNTLLAPLEQQSLGMQLRSNAILCRGLGSVSDRWDRYCAVRRTGRSSYVAARHTYLGAAADGDDGLSNKHPGASSLLAAKADGSSAAMQLAT